MINQTYQIVNLPGLSGLHCVARYNEDVCLFEIIELINVGIVIGDRFLRYPLPDRAMWLSGDFLKETDDITAREFSTDNPFGEYKYEGRYQKGDLVITHVMFEDAITVTILEENAEKTKTLYTGNFFDNKQIASEIIEEVLHGRIEPEDAIFELKNLEDK